MKYRPTFNRLLVEQIKTEEGLIARAKEDFYTWGKVLAVGGMVGQRGERKFETFKEGDIVAYHRGAVNVVNIGSETFTLLDDDKIVAVREE